MDLGISRISRLTRIGRIERIARIADIARRGIKNPEKFQGLRTGRPLIIPCNNMSISIL